MPPHHTYIETHLGGGNVLERKKPAARTIGVDVDRSLIARWSERRRRLPFDVELHCMDAVEYLKAFTFTGGELVYSDPPYMQHTRVSKKLYEHEYSDGQHRELLAILVTLPCFVIVDGYPSPLYEETLQHHYGWRWIDFPNTTRGGKFIERAWFNFPPPAELHDCRYAGEDYRERERIKRKRDRWTRRFIAMGSAERQVVYEALLASRDPIGVDDGSGRRGARP
jgi:site-specific DNA-adenine methylase